MQLKTRYLEMAELAAILDFRANERPDDKIDIKYGFLDPKNPWKDMLLSTIGQIVAKPIFKMADGGHFEFQGQGAVGW